MKIIIQNLRKNHISQRISLLIAFGMNFFVITIMFLFSTGIANILNEKLNATTQDQIMQLLGSIVLVAVISIVFFQWIIMVLLSALLEERKNDSIRFKLLGASNFFLIKMYIKELLELQIVAMPVSIILAYTVFLIVANHYDLTIKNIDIKLVMLVVFLYLVNLLLTSIFVFKKIVKFDAIEMMRKQEKYSIGKLKRNHILLFFIGLVIPVFIHYFYLTNIIAHGNYDDLLKFVRNVVSIILMFNFIYFIFHNGILCMLHKFSYTFISVSELYMIGYYKKIRSIIIIEEYLVSIEPSRTNSKIMGNESREGW